jgi:hypothetical protein
MFSKKLFTLTWQIYQNNWEKVELVFERNTSWKSLFSRWRQALHSLNRVIQVSWRNTCISPKKTIYVRNRTI